MQTDPWWMTLVSQTSEMSEYSNVVLVFVFRRLVSAVDNFPEDVWTCLSRRCLRDVTVEAGESTLITTANKNSGASDTNLMIHVRGHICTRPASVVDVSEEPRWTCRQKKNIISPSTVDPPPLTATVSPVFAAGNGREHLALLVFNRTESMSDVSVQYFKVCFHVFLHSIYYLLLIKLDGSRRESHRINNGRTVETSSRISQLFTEPSPMSETRLALCLQLVLK